MRSTVDERLKIGKPFLECERYELEPCTLLQMCILCGFLLLSTVVYDCDARKWKEWSAWIPWKTRPQDIPGRLKQCGRICELFLVTFSIQVWPDHNRMDVRKLRFKINKRLQRGEYTMHVPQGLDLSEGIHSKNSSEDQFWGRIQGENLCRHLVSPYWFVRSMDDHSLVGSIAVENIFGLL